MCQTKNNSANSAETRKENSDIEVEKFQGRYSFKQRMNALKDTSNVLYYGSIIVFETLAMAKKLRLHTEYWTEQGYTHIIIFKKCSETS